MEDEELRLIREITMKKCNVVRFSHGGGQFACAVGLPAKSGVSGNILAVSPGRLAIAVYSPRIDSAGNSVRGQAFFAALVQELPELSLFFAPTHASAARSRDARL